MPRHSRSLTGKLPDLNFVLLVVMLIVLWIAGGASRADVLGQTVVRAVAWLVAIIAILFAPKPNLKPVAPVAFLLFASAALVVLQLIPLPPSIWTSLPGRELVTQSAILSDQQQPWRPISLSPDATINALSSLVVPAVVFFLAAGLAQENQKRLLSLLLGLVVASSLVGLLQFSGSRFDNPFINNVSRTVSATFANRNHFALMLACGCVLAPLWAFQSSRSPRWKAVASAGLVVVFVLMILATGSRAGLILGTVGVALGIISVQSRIRKRLRQLPRRVWLPVVASIAGLFLVVISLSIMLDRAVSIDRVFGVDASEDLRRAALPTIWKMVKVYWPVGSGVGTFDPVYRIHEPYELLNILYLNHAHNDWLEFVLDEGILGLLLLVAAIGWWGWASFKTWRKPLESHLVLARAGSVIMFLIAMAGIFDYPARTPMVMALVTIAAIWLSSTGEVLSSARGTKNGGGQAGALQGGD